MKGHISHHLPVVAGEPVLPRQPAAWSILRWNHSVAGSTCCRWELQHCMPARKCKLPLKSHLCAVVILRRVREILMPEVSLLLAWNWWQNYNRFQAEIASDLLPSSVRLLFSGAGSCFNHGLDSLVMSLSDSKNFAELPCDSLLSRCLWHFSFSRPTPA